MTSFQRRLLTSLILIPISLLLILEGDIYFQIFLSTAFIISSYEWLKMSRRFDLKIIGILFLLFSFYSAFYFRSQNLEGFLLIILICISTDIGGYIFGKLFKGPKLTKISPNKTQSGLIGGYLLAVFSSTVFVLKYTESIYIDQNLIRSDLKFVILILLISSVSQIGDLLVSYFKRLSKIKNTGKIFPGHGGLLDRIDGMIFVFPFMYVMNFIWIIAKL